MVSQVEKNTELGNMPTGVSRKVVEAFIAELASKEEFAGVASRLKTEIIDNNNISEAAIRQALFEDDLS